MLDDDIIATARLVPIETIVTGLPLRRVGRELIGACPACGGTDRFAVHIGKQVFNCRGCGAKGDVIALAMLVHGVDFVDAVKMLIGDRPATKSPPRYGDLPDPKFPSRNRNLPDGNLALADRIWREAVPLGEDAAPGRDYLARRGIVLDATVPDFAGLRFHPRCPWHDGVTPAVVARFTTVIGNEPRGIWRRPITGRTKPMSLGPTSGCVIRLWPDEDVAEGLAIGEGIETTLAAATRIIYRNTLPRPAWATGNASGIASFPVLSGIESLTILVDNDLPDAHGRRAGPEAAESCAARWLAAGREVTLITPSDLGLDFNDLVKP